MHRIIHYWMWVTAAVAPVHSQGRSHLSSLSLSGFDLRSSSASKCKKKQCNVWKPLQLQMNKQCNCTVNAYLRSVDKAVEEAHKYKRLTLYACMCAPHLTTNQNTYIHNRSLNIYVYGFQYLILRMKPQTVIGLGQLHFACTCGLGPPD